MQLLGSYARARTELTLAAVKIPKIGFEILKVKLLTLRGIIICQVCRLRVLEGLDEVYGPDCHRLYNYAGPRRQGTRRDKGVNGLDYLCRYVSKMH